MRADGRKVVGRSQLREAVAKVADARENQLLYPYRQRVGGHMGARAGETCLGIGKLLGAPYPLDLVAKLLDSVDETPDVACDVVEEVNCGHSDSRAPQAAVTELGPTPVKWHQQVHKSSPARRGVESIAGQRSRPSKVGTGTDGGV